MPPPCNVIWCNTPQMAALVRFHTIKALDTLQKMKIWACGKLMNQLFLQRRSIVQVAPR